MDIDTTKPVEVAGGIYWVGFDDKESGLRCNPYLMLDGDEAVLFDPGSAPHYPQVLSKVTRLIPFERISHIIVTHQDPDLCGAIPRFEELVYGVGGSMRIVTSSRASVLIAHYGIRSKFYNVDMEGWSLTLRSGRRLRFIFTPYLHFPGAFMTWDEKSGVLFSGDIFGAFSFDWSFYANETYGDAMAAFHENYMPSSDILRRAMEKLDGLDIKLIAPQHGSIIKENPRRYIDILKRLECGDYMTSEGG